jgi:hypothetical protein
MAMMKKIDNLDIWEILSTPSGAKNDLERLDAAWSAFVIEIQNYCRGERNLTERARKLWYIRSRIAVIQETNNAGAGEKCADPSARYPRT